MSSADAPTGSPWPSVGLALVCAAALAGGLVWQARREVVAVHGATHYRAIDATLATAGRLLPEAPTALAAAGFEVVIDVRTPEEGTEDERVAVEAAGLRYLNLPVTGTPERAQFAAFSAALAGERSHKVLVHCSSNKRASTMVMLHRVTREGVPYAVARRDLEAVWQPRSGWERYIAGILADPPPAPGAP